MGWGDLGSTTMDTVVPDDVLADEDEQELLLLRGGGVAGLHGRDGVLELFDTGTSDVLSGSRVSSIISWTFFLPGNF